MRGPRLSRILAGAAALVLVPGALAGQARAGGLMLPGSGPVSTSRAGASVVSTDDPASIGINPAGLAKSKGTVVHVGAALIAYHQTFGRAGTYETTEESVDPWEGQPYGSVSDDSSPPIGLGPFQAVPVIAVSSDLGGKIPGLVVAAGVFAPNAYPTRAMGADYQIEDPNVPPPPTRYDIIEQKAAIVLPSIAVAYETLGGKLHLGGRFSFGFADIEARTYLWGLQNLEEWVGKDAEFSVSVKDSFVPAWGLGVQYLVVPSVEVGAAFQSGLNVNGKGTGTSKTGSGTGLAGNPVVVLPAETPLCAPGGTIEAFKACIDLSLPMAATVGARYIVRDASDRQVADVELNVQWENWGGEVGPSDNRRKIGDYLVIVDGFAAVDVGPPPVGLNLNPTLIRHNLQNTLSVRLGGSWQTPIGDKTLVLRGGVAHDTAAAKEGWQRVDFDGAARWTFAAGASLALKKVRIDLGAGMVYEGSRTQGTGCNPALGNTGCGPGGATLPVDDRVGPDPIQPTSDSSGQQESPFTAGTLTSGYNLLMLGVTTWF